MNELHLPTSQRGALSRSASVCVIAMLAWTLFVTQSLFDETNAWRNRVTDASAPFEDARARAENMFSEAKTDSLRSQSLQGIQRRWDAVWQADAAAAELNVGHLRSATNLIERSERGDLEASIDLIGAATWCLSAGPMANVVEVNGNVRLLCYERFGDDLASRERLERASFVWLMRLASAGIDDATLYASALTRGIGANVLGGANDDPVLRETQRAQIMGQLHSMAQRGSAEAASELNGHYGGDSYLTPPNLALALHYAKLTDTLDPARTLLVRGEP